jgi:ribosomal protein L44E
MSNKCKCGGQMQFAYNTVSASKPRIKISFTYRCNKCDKLVTQRKRQPRG